MTESRNTPESSACPLHPLNVLTIDFICHALAGRPLDWEGCSCSACRLEVFDDIAEQAEDGTTKGYFEY